MANGEYKEGFWLNPLTLRVGYIILAQLVAHGVAFLSLANVQSWLSHIFENPALKPGAASFLEPQISGVFLIGGEFVYRWWHDKIVLPRVSAKISS